MHRFNRKYSVHSLIVLIILVVAFNLRVLLLALGWPPLDSDQAYIGLMGMHIAFNHDFPIFFYGQGYMGAFEAYVAAILFSIFGSSTFILQLGVTILFLGFLITMYFFTRMLYGKKLAVVTIILLSLGSNVKLTHEMIALAGYTETLLFGSLIMFIASYLSLTSHGAKRLQIRRLSLFAAWGLISGVGLWTNLLVAPFVLTSGLLLLIFCFKELFGLASIVIITFFIVGVLPVIIYNKDAAPGQDTFTYISKVHSAHGIKTPPLNDRLNGTLQIAIPHATGAIYLCTHAQQQNVNLKDPVCTLPHLLWPAGLVTLWFLAFALSIKDFLKTIKKHIERDEKRKQVILISSRIALLITGVMVFSFYAASPNAALYPIPSSRYIIGLFISLPAILWPLLANRAGKAIIIIIGIIYSLGTVYIFFGSPNPRQYVQQSGLSALQVADQQLDVPEVQRLTRQQYALINSLFSLGIYTIYSDYWTCARLMFQAKERIYCGAVTENFRHGHNRYPLYAETVKNDPRAAYVFPIGSPQTTIFLSLNSKYNPSPYKYIQIDGYDIYIPQGK